MTTKQFFNFHGNEILSLLRIESGSKFNHIYVTSNTSTNTTIPKRSPNIGLAQLDIRGNTFSSMAKNGKPFYKAQKYYVRVETNMFNNRLCIISKKVPSLEKSDYLVFGDEYSLYISKGRHTWLTEKKYYRLEQMKTIFGEMQVNSYDISMLMADQCISYVYTDELASQVVAYTNSCENRLHECSYPLQDYSNELFDLSILTIQSDPKTPNNCYYCFSGSRYCDRLGTVPTIAKCFSELLQVKTCEQVKSGIYYAMRKVRQDGKAHYYKVKLSEEKAQEIYNNINIDSSIVVEKNSKHYLVIYMSAIKNFDIVENALEECKTADIKKYRKANRGKYRGKYKGKYRGKYNLKNKISIYLKRHENKFNPKWNSEEIKIATEILSKQKN